MVEDRVTDGTRIAQLLASELSGREDGGLDAVSVVDADPDAEPSPAGTTAYRVAIRDEVVATVVIFPEAAELELAGPGTGTDASVEGDVPLDAVTVRERAREVGLATTDGGRCVRVDSGAAVKRALDAVRAGL